MWAVCSQPSFIQQLANKVTGTSNSHQRIKPKDLLATEVTDPRSMGQQVRLQIAALSKRARHARREIVIATELRDTLLPRLMSGEIKVRDAEKAVEEAT
jgi:type I restriction enzyme S subunit